MFCFIAILVLLRWSGSEPAISPRYACSPQLINRIKEYQNWKEPEGSSRLIAANFIFKQWDHIIKCSLNHNMKVDTSRAASGKVFWETLRAVATEAYKRNFWYFAKWSLKTSSKAQHSNFMDKEAKFRIFM